jgi:calcium-dependent protein kinase
MKKELSTEETDRMFHEFETVRQLDHPNIIKIYEVIEDRKKFHLVTELYTGGELFERMISAEKLTENTAAKYMHQILSTMMYCHSNNIVHRDLKPENILFQRDTPDSPLVIIDFGCSRTIKPHEKMSRKQGTMYYMAPEIFHGQYDKQCDVWSVGVILYIIL